MESKDILNSISLFEFEATTTLPIEEFEVIDNSVSIKFIKRQKFNQKAILNKAKYTLMLNKISEDTKQKIEILKDFSLEVLMGIIKERGINFQFRNIEKLDENQIREIISDLYMLDELKDEE